MSTQVTRSIKVRKPYDEVAAFVTDPGELLPTLEGFAAYNRVAIGYDSETWDMHIDVGSIHVGSRVRVTSLGEGHLVCTSQRGIDHSVEFTVTGDKESVVEVVFTLDLPGALFAKVSELLARGIAARHLEAGLEQVRHRLEFSA